MDYRYDPIYQRGHEGSGHEQQGPEHLPAQEEPARQEQPVPPEQSRQHGQPTQQREEAQPVEVAPVTPAGERVAPQGQPTPAAQQTVARSNPYVLGLTIAGVILAAAGVVSIIVGAQFMNMRMMPAGIEEEQNAFQMLTYGQALTSLGPFLLALGLGTLLGVTFLKAHTWQKLNRPTGNR